MSTFPKRLVDELDDGHARRLLARAHTDQPPARLVRDAIQAASKAGKGGNGAPPSSPNEAPRASSRSRIAIAAGTLMAGGLLAWFGTRELTTTSQAPVNEDGVSARATKVDVRASAVANPPSVTAESEPATSVANLPDAPAPIATTAPTNGPTTAIAMTAPAPTHRRAAEAPLARENATANTTPTAPAGDPADLLREANRLRAQGRWSEAASTYQRVIDLGQGSAEAYPADVALGNLDLQQSRAAEALARYEHALASHPGGALSEEARWGKARALRALGRAGEERAALEEFRARHPESPLVPAATQRLAELGR